MPKLVQETGRITEAAVAQAKDTGRLPVQLISPGWGSSGYYSSEVLEAAVADGLFPSGTHMYADHPTAEEAKARPVRSIKDLMSVTATPGRLATEEDVAAWGADPGAVVAEVDVLPAYREVIEHLAGAIGVSIRGDGELVEGTAEGRKGPIVESLAHVQSVDWVTRAGRGGRVLSLVESARATQAAISRHGLDESTARDTEEALRTALRDAHGTADRTYVWVRDFDPDLNPPTVWFEIDSPNDDAGLYAQAYSQADNGAITLSGSRTEVQVQTKFVPVARPGSTTPTEESEEDTMPNIEESELARLREDAGRVTALEERATTAERERDEARAERDTLREADARRTRTERAGQIVEARATEAGVSYTPLEVRGFCADLPINEDGTLDEAAFTTAVDEDAAKRKAAGGAGQVIGMGGTSGGSGGGTTVGWAQIDEALGLGKGA